MALGFPDLLRIHVLWSEASLASEATAELISKHFDGIGMERDGVAHRVPVRFRSAPWDGGGYPLAVDLNAATHNAIVLLNDDFLHQDSEMWSAYVENLHVAIKARGNVDVYIPFGCPLGGPVLPVDAGRHVQYARRDIWEGRLSPEARKTRLLLHLVFKIREHLRGVFGGGESEPLFVSHAKADGDTTAKAIVDYVCATGHDVPLRTFYDAMELSPGDDFKEKFETTIGRGTLLAIVSDAYDSRPWCVQELTTAKRARRPIVLADVGQVRTSRTFPYGANLPKVRVRPDPASTEWIEPILVETLSEGLRCDLFQAQTTRLLSSVGIPDALVLPRPPELFDIIDHASIPATIVYPDPPLGDIEDGLLRRSLNLAAPGARLMTMSELS